MSRAVECLQAIEAYIRPAFDSPLDDDRNLSIRDFKKLYGFPNDTIYKVNGNERIKAAKEFVKEARAEADQVPATSRIDRVRETRDEYRDLYEKLLEKWILMVDYLQSEKDIDIEAAVRNHELPPLRRSSRGPISQRSRGKKSR